MKLKFTALSLCIALFTCATVKTQSIAQDLELAIQQFSTQKDNETTALVWGLKRIKYNFDKNNKKISDSKKLIESYNQNILNFRMKKFHIRVTNRIGNSEKFDHYVRVYLDGDLVQDNHIIPPLPWIDTNDYRHNYKHKYKKDMDKSFDLLDSVINNILLNHTN